MIKNSQKTLSKIIGYLAVGLYSLAICANSYGQNIAAVKQNNITVQGPARDARDMLPIGNGDIGAGVWVEKDGALVMLIGKTDAWGEYGRLLKVGRLRIETSPPLYTNGVKITQKLDISAGTVIINSVHGDQHTTMRLWVDANRPVITVDTESTHKFGMSVSLDLWRTKERALSPKREYHCVDGMTAHQPPRVYPDHILPVAQNGPLKNHLVWYHRNEKSVYPVTLKLQKLTDFHGTDPLLHRTFGCAVGGSGFKAKNAKVLKTSNSRRHQTLTIHPLTAQTDSAKSWSKQLAGVVMRDTTTVSDLESLYTKHCQWWKKFWERSWVNVSGGNPQETAKITLGWHANRYLVACTARGAYPVKFNGSIFNVPGFGRNSKKVNWVTPDFRSWGTPFWFQNQRHIYWPMLQAGDYEQMLPFFNMYLKALPLAKKRSEVYYHHHGVLFPETMMFWGTYLNSNYGWNRTGKPDGLTDNGYIRRYWQGGLELTAMMLSYYDHTQDRKFAAAIILPIASEIVTFYDQHYKRNSNGKIVFYPAQILESVWDAENPMPEIAGLYNVLPRLLALPQKITSKSQRKQWNRILSELPPLPQGKVNGEPTLLGAAKIMKSKRHNQENARLYAVWPYRLFGVGLPNCKLALNSWKTRPVKKSPDSCWHNDIVWAAYLGLPDQARHALASRFTLSGNFTFPAMYIQGDWIPDHDNGGVCQNTVQSMLMQSVGNKIILLPAWPKDWNVDFKLHAPMQTTVAGRVKNGKLVGLTVTPKRRLKDIEIDKSWK